MYPNQKQKSFNTQYFKFLPRYTSYFNFLPQYTCVLFILDTSSNSCLIWILKVKERSSYFQSLSFLFNYSTNRDLHHQTVKLLKFFLEVLLKFGLMLLLREIILKFILEVLLQFGLILRLSLFNTLIWKYFYRTDAKKRSNWEDASTFNISNNLSWIMVSTQ